MTKDLANMSLPDDPFMLEVIEVMRRYHDAQALGSSAEVGRFWMSHSFRQ